MAFQTDEERILQNKLHKSGLNQELILKLLTNKRSPAISELINILVNSSTHEMTLSSIVDMSINNILDKSPIYIDRRNIPLIFPISLRRFDSLVNDNHTPYLKISRKISLFDSQDIYTLLNKYNINQKGTK